MRALQLPGLLVHLHCGSKGWQCGDRGWEASTLHCAIVNETKKQSRGFCNAASLVENSTGPQHSVSTRGSFEVDLGLHVAAEPCTHSGSNITSRRELL